MARAQTQGGKARAPGGRAAASSTGVCCCGGGPEGCDEGPYPSSCGWWRLSPPLSGSPCWANGPSEDRVGTFTVQFSATQTNVRTNTSSPGSPFGRILDRRSVFYRGTFGQRIVDDFCRIVCLRFEGARALQITYPNSGEVFLEDYDYSADCADADDPGLISDRWRSSIFLGLATSPNGVAGSTGNALPLIALGQSVSLGVVQPTLVAIPGWGSEWADSDGCASFTDEASGVGPSGPWSASHESFITASPYRYVGSYRFTGNNVTGTNVLERDSWSINYSARFWDFQGNRVI